MQYPIMLKMADGTEKQFWISDEKLQFGGDSGGIKGITVGGAEITPVDGVVNIPKTSATSLGVMKVGNHLTYNGDGTLMGKIATDVQLEQRTAWALMTPSQIPIIVKNGMTSASDTAWTDTEKAAGRARMDAEKNTFNLLTTLSTTEEGVSVLQCDLPEDSEELMLVVNKLYAQTATTLQESLNVGAWQSQAAFNWGKMHQLGGCFPRPTYNTGFIWLKKLGRYVMHIVSASQTSAANATNPNTSLGAKCMVNGNKLFLFIGNFSRTFSTQDSIDVYVR